MRCSGGQRDELLRNDEFSRPPPICQGLHDCKDNTAQYLSRGKTGEQTQANYTGVYTNLLDFEKEGKRSHEKLDYCISGRRAADKTGERCRCREHFANRSADDGLFVMMLASIYREEGRPWPCRWNLWQRLAIYGHCVLW
jgi:hypothetical protein